MRPSCKRVYIMKNKYSIKKQLSSQPMSLKHLETCRLVISLTKDCCNWVAFRVFFCKEKRLIRNFCLLLRSQEWHEGNSWFVTLSLALCAMRAPPNLHSLGLCAHQGPVVERCIVYIMNCVYSFNKAITMKTHIYDNPVLLFILFYPSHAAFKS